MPLSTKKQIRDHVLSVTQQDSTQIGAMVNDFINMSLLQINDPAWAFSRRLGGNGEDFHHLWSWLKRKTTFSTSSGTTDYVLERDIDKIAIIRQTASPTRLTQLTDEEFYTLEPNPTAQGNPRIYRLWEIDGVSPRLASSDKIDVLSSSANDGSAFTVSVIGYVNGQLLSESYTLNGTTAVAGSNTFDAREIFVSKSANTTGTITARKNSDSSTLVTLGPQETSPRFKIVSLYPRPSSTLTMYVEYYKRVRELVNDSDVPEFDQKWHYVVTLGALCKVYQALGKVSDFESCLNLFASAVRSMVASDRTVPDLIEYARKHSNRVETWARRSEETVS